MACDHPRSEACDHPRSEPGSPGVAGEHPNRVEGDDGGRIGPLDEAPDGRTPSDPTDSDPSSLPPGAG